jgi:hypothetical protein
MVPINDILAPDCGVRTGSLGCGLGDPGAASPWGSDVLLSSMSTEPKLMESVGQCWHPKLYMTSNVGMGLERPHRQYTIV